jgi:hypothetical protein
MSWISFVPSANNPASLDQMKDVLSMKVGEKKSEEFVVNSIMNEMKLKEGQGHSDLKEGFLSMIRLSTNQFCYFLGSTIVKQYISNLKGMYDNPKLHSLIEKASESFPYAIECIINEEEDAASKILFFYQNFKLFALTTDEEFEELEHKISECGSWDDLRQRNALIEPLDVLNSKLKDFQNMMQEAKENLILATEGTALSQITPDVFEHMVLKKYLQPESI